MSTPLISIDSSASIAEILDVMFTNNIPRLMVMENDIYVGISSPRTPEIYNRIKIAFFL
jgi:CBS domain-containing protein